MAAFLERAEAFDAGDPIPGSGQAAPRPPTPAPDFAALARPFGGRSDPSRRATERRPSPQPEPERPVPTTSERAADFADADAARPETMTRFQEARCETLEAQLRVSQAAESAALAEARFARAAEIEELDMDALQALPGSRLEFAQRLAEKRMELEKWQQALQQKSQHLEELEKMLCSSQGRVPQPKVPKAPGAAFASTAGSDGIPFLSAKEFMHGARASLAAIKAVAQAGLAISWLAIALAKPVFGGLKTAGCATARSVAGCIQAAMARAAAEAHARELAQATSIRRSRYYAAAGAGTTASSPKRDGSGVPPARYGRVWDSPAHPTLCSHGPMMSPGWQPSPIYPVSPAPSMHSVPLQPVYERQSMLGWIRRNSGCSSRHRPSNAYQAWPYALR